MLPPPFPALEAAIASNAFIQKLRGETLFLIEAVVELALKPSRDTIVYPLGYPCESKLQQPIFCMKVSIVKGGVRLLTTVKEAGNFTVVQEAIVRSERRSRATEKEWFREYI